MCKILTIINTKPENNEIIQQIIDANSSQLQTERCGYSVLRDNMATYHLRDSYKDFDANVVYRGENVFCIHSRTSTGGDSDERGLHLKRIGKWFWAHNGTVTHFAGVKDFNDSYYFFQSLISKVDIAAIDEPIDKKLIEDACQFFGFNGKGFLWNIKTKTLMWFCNYPSYIYLLDGAIIISSWDINKTLYDVEISSVLGFDYYSKYVEYPIQFLHTEKLDDSILVFQNNELILRDKGDFRKKWANNVPVQSAWHQNDNGYTDRTKSHQSTTVLKKLTKKERRILKQIDKAIAEDDNVRDEFRGSLLIDPQTGELKSKYIPEVIE